MDLFLLTKEIQGEHLVWEDLLDQIVLRKIEVFLSILEILRDTLVLVQENLH